MLDLKRLIQIRGLALPIAAAGLAWALLPSSGAQAFKLHGGSLRNDFRHVRVFNNFSDPEANSNQLPDPSFPGYVGAELAIWKACVEWGSELHFEGNGDPLQPADLGSGGANFDCSWQGRALAVGTPNDNIHSEIGGGGLGVLAFTEAPTSDGWRIRYYREPWVFYDIPDHGPNGTNLMDLQGIAAHEYGHALGLDHSNSGAATMFPNALLGGTSWRSIAADDSKGIQAIYGARSASKPHIETYTLLPGGEVFITGTGFHAFSNEVWFTQAASGGAGFPVTVYGVISANGGTELTVMPPPEAGPGDLLVKGPGPSFDSISNAFPFSPTAEPCGLPTRYGTGKLTSSGGVATIGWTGYPSLSMGDFKLTLSGGPMQSWGLVFWGNQPQSSPFKGGLMLVARPQMRDRRFTTDAFGFMSTKIKSDPSMIGQTRYYQIWFKDPLDPFKAGTSDALEITFCP